MAALAPSVYSFPVLLLIVLLHVNVLALSPRATTALFVSPALTTTRTRAVGAGAFIPNHSRLDCGVLGRHHHGVLCMAENNNNAAGDDNASSFLLEKEYELTEQMVTQRGEIEEMLMADSPMRPILPNEPAAAAAAAVKPQRGFGASAAKKGKKRNTKTTKKDVVLKEQQQPQNNKPEEAKDHAKVLKNEGLVRIDRTLSDAVTDTLRDFVYDIRTMEGNKLQKANTNMQDIFPTIRRWDLSIPLFEYDDHGGATTATTIAHQALHDVLQKTAVGETMSLFLGTDQAELYELASYISDPGSSRQVVHSDTPCFGTNDEQPILCTCFIALQDVRMDMGPTVWLPKTNTYAMHDLFFHEEEEEDSKSSSTTTSITSTPMKDQFLQTQASVVGILPKGSCVLFDSRLLHCGTANKSGKDSRALLFFSFKHPNVNLVNPGGDTASIRPDLKGRCRLSDFL